MIRKLFFTTLLIIPFINAQEDTALILSEIMFYPESGPNEFIELYNFSNTDSIDLSGYKFKYSTSSADEFIDAGEGTILPPQSFAVIFEGDYTIGSGIYDSRIPPEALVLKISDNSFGSSGMANTADRSVMLLSSAGDTLETYIYSADNSQSFSDEKKELVNNGSPSNWDNSVVSNGTPGFRNSITPFTDDLELTSLTFSPQFPVEGDEVTIFAKATNRGLMNAAAYSVEIYNDVNTDSVGDPNELIFSQNYSNLSEGDSLIVSMLLNNLSEGKYQIIAKVIFNNDENTTNNQLIISLTVFPPGNNYNDLVVNEIMYAPSSGEPEWIELFNRSSSAVNLKKWEISDLSTTVTITPVDNFIQPGEYIVLTKDSSISNFYNVPSEIIEINIPSLNNTGDAIVIKDTLNVLIDSVLYSPDWGGNTGRKSLERISVDESSNDIVNWATSLSPFNATPGMINSVTPKDYDLAITSFKSLKDFGIVGDEIQFNIQIYNKGLHQSDNYNVSLYKDANSDSIPSAPELISTQNGNSLASGDSSTFTFQTNEFEQGLNHFIAVITTTLDDDTTNNIGFTNVIGATVNEVRNDIVINEIMHSPDSPEPEWIEIYNRSNKNINLKNYQLSDNSDTVRVVDNYLLINPEEYVMITKDTSIYSFYNISSKIVLKNFAALNNSGDKVILLDSLNRTIDSLHYLSSWGGTNGRSLERIDVDASSTDSINWATSQSVFKATPGSVNSVTQKDFDIAVKEIYFSPVFPLDHDTVKLSAKILNKGLNLADFTLQLFEDTNLDSLPDILIETTSSFNLVAGDSGIFRFNYRLEDIQNTHGFYMRSIFSQDQDTTNNVIYRNISPGYPPQSIVVNEIMYSPSNGEPEWVELFNNSNTTINLKDWSITDVITTPVSIVIDEDVIMSPGSYLTLAKDISVLDYHRLIPSLVYEISLPNLNNDIDGIVLKDSRGAVIDSVLYNSDWGGTAGHSLERREINVSSNLPTNWGSSTDIELSTPGRINSITPKQFDLSLKEMNFNPRFPVSGDDVFISALIKNNGSANAENFSVEFLIDTDSNDVVDQLLSMQAALNLETDDSIYVVSIVPIENLTSKILAAVRIVYTKDEDTLNNYFEKSVEPGFAQKSLVINEVMYSPVDNEPEWVELVNISNDSVSLKNWLISDILSTPTKNIITTSDVFLQPAEFIVVAKDTSFYSFHPDITSKVLLTSFGSLGNTKDGIIVYDFREGIIDSLLYRSSWGGKNGYSLERISVNEETNDSINWTSSLSVNRSTPGASNSIENTPSYKKGDVAINEIMFDPGEDNSEYIEFVNLSGKMINIGGWRLEDENGNFYKLSETTYTFENNSYYVVAADSLIFSKYFLNGNVGVGNTSSLGLVNTGELILLKDVKGNVIDSVWYSDKWHNDNFTDTKNISLERINPKLNGNNPDNWSSSADMLGGTPTKQNSVFTDNLNIENKLSVSPNPFSPDNDGFEDFTLINYKLKQATSQVRIKIFDSKGRLVRTLVNNQASGSSGSVIFDGRNDSGEALRIGIYIIFLEAINEGNGVVENMKTVVVIARKL